MHRIKRISQKEKNKVVKIFNWLGGLPIDVFKPTNWNVLYIECRPFIDQDSYKYFTSLFSSLEEKEFNILHYPLSDGEKYIQVSQFPEYEIFDNLMLEYSYRASGGIAFGSNLNWAIYSDPDNHILFFGYAECIEPQVKEFFLSNSFIISKEKLVALYQEHKLFLEGDD